MTQLAHSSETSPIIEREVLMELIAKRLANANPYNLLLTSNFIRDNEISFRLVVLPQDEAGKTAMASAAKAVIESAVAELTLDRLRTVAGLLQGDYSKGHEVKHVPELVDQQRNTLHDLLLYTESQAISDIAFTLAHSDVYRQFQPGMTTDQQIKLLLDHCFKAGIVDKLLDLVESKNPNGFAVFKSELVDVGLIFDEN